ncbi:hypothetical protein EVB91_087 [Rhizobium phage RHph_I1_18]|nr:hypothetical protein EVB91_087 [Rhizobium phage RHph_I1_18]
MANGDFTKAQAKRWVEQEAGKHTDIHSIVARIETEKKQAADPIMQMLSADFPNSTQAHKDLISVLQAKLKAY